MAQAQQFILAEGQVKVRLNGIGTLNARKITVRVTRPVQKLKSGTIVAVAVGIPDVELDFDWITPADRQLWDGLNLALREDPLSGMIEYGVQRYKVDGIFAASGGIDNEPGNASLSNTSSCQAALIKQVQ